MDTQAKASRNVRSDDPRKKLQTYVEILTRWFQKWSAVFPNHPVSKLQVATYAEALIDLAPAVLERGCEEANRVMEQFPKPGHIRSGAYRFSEEREEYLGVPQLTYPDISQEEREAALADAEYQEQKKKALNSKIRIVAQQKRALGPSGSDGMVLATNERLDELARQKQKILSK